MLCNSGFLLKVMTVLPTWLDHIEEFKKKKIKFSSKRFPRQLPSCWKMLVKPLFTPPFLWLVQAWFLDTSADITHDPNQLLFQKCMFLSKGESQCERNVPKIFTQSACRLHEELPKTMKRPDVSKDLTDAKERAKWVSWKKFLLKKFSNDWSHLWHEGAGLDLLNAL